MSAMSVLHDFEGGQVVLGQFVRLVGYDVCGEELEVRGLVAVLLELGLQRIHRAARVGELASQRGLFVHVVEQLTHAGDLGLQKLDAVGVIPRTRLHQVLQFAARDCQSQFFDCHVLLLFAALNAPDGSRTRIFLPGHYSGCSAN